MKVAFFSTKSYDRFYFDRFNSDKRHELTYLEDHLNPETAALTRGFDAACVFVNDRVDRPTLEILAERGVKIVALRCAGFNNVDLAAAKELGLSVVRVPRYSPHAVAEHAVALLLTLNRKIHRAYNRVRDGNFSLEKLVGFDLFEKTVGLIGTGSIGAIFATIMRGFGCQVLAYDLYPNPELEAQGVHYDSIEAVQATSQILSLHCPLTPETHHLMDAAAFRRMPKGSFLINTSRGGLVNTAAAIDALKSGQLGALAIDVYEQEEQLFFQDLSEHIIQDDQIARLMTFPNVLITAHQGFFTEEALSEIARVSLQNLTTFEKGDPLENLVH